MKNHFLKICVTVVTSCLFSGCATESTVSTRRYLWPPPPEQARIEWMKAYSSQLDFPKSLSKKLKYIAVGDDVPTRFEKPLDIRCDNRGRFYVTDPGIPGVVVYDEAESQVLIFPRGDSDLQMKEPLFVAVDGDGSIYVSDRLLQQIVVMTREGVPVRAISLGGKVGRIAALVVDPQRKRLLVSDTKLHKVVVLTLEGDFLFEFGGPGEKEGRFNFPVSLAVGPGGEVIVADAMNARIQIFDSEGRFLRMFGQRGDGRGDFQQIKAVALDSDRNIYVTDGRAHRFLVFDFNGRFLLSVGGLYSVSEGKIGPGGFVSPQGIDISRDNRIYVVDQLNRRVQVFRYLPEKETGGEAPFDGSK